MHVIPESSRSLYYNAPLAVLLVSDCLAVLMLSFHCLCVTIYSRK